MTALVYCHGHVLLASCVLPLDSGEGVIGAKAGDEADAGAGGQSTRRSGSLVYGSADGGQSVRCDSIEFSALMRALGGRLNLKAHTVGRTEQRELHAPGDLEGHIGNDGRAYVIDSTRLMPLEPPPPRVLRSAGPFSHLTRQLRPELVALSPTPLSPDSFTRWGWHQAKRNNTEVRHAYALLLDKLLPRAARALYRAARELQLHGDRTREQVQYQRQVRWRQGLASLLHSHGANVRCMLLLLPHLRTRGQQGGRDRALAVLECRKLILRECVARCAKQELRRLRSSAMDRSLAHAGTKAGSELMTEVPQTLEAQRKAAARYLNVLLGTSVASHDYWARDGILRQIVMSKFVDPMVAAVEVKGNKVGWYNTAREKLEAIAGDELADLSLDFLGIEQLRERICEMCDIEMSPSVSTTFAASDVQLGCVRCQPMSFVRLLEGESMLEEARSRAWAKALTCAHASGGKNDDALPGTPCLPDWAWTFIADDGRENYVAGGAFCTTVNAAPWVLPKAITATDEMVDDLLKSTATCLHQALQCPAASCEQVAHVATRCGECELALALRDAQRAMAAISAAGVKRASLTCATGEQNCRSSTAAQVSDDSDDEDAHIATARQGSASAAQECEPVGFASASFSSARAHIRRSIKMLELARSSSCEEDCATSDQELFAAFALLARCLMSEARMFTACGASRQHALDAMGMASSSTDDKDIPISIVVQMWRWQLNARKLHHKAQRAWQRAAAVAKEAMRVLRFPTKVAPEGHPSAPTQSATQTSALWQATARAHALAAAGCTAKARAVASTSAARLARCIEAYASVSNTSRDGDVAALTAITVAQRSTVATKESEIFEALESAMTLFGDAAVSFAEATQYIARAAQPSVSTAAGDLCSVKLEAVALGGSAMAAIELAQVREASATAAVHAHGLRDTAAEKALTLLLSDLGSTEVIAEADLAGGTSHAAAPLHTSLLPEAARRLRGALGLTLASARAAAASCDSSPSPKAQFSSQMLGTTAKSWSYVAESTVTCHVDVQLLVRWRRCWQQHLRLACTEVERLATACAQKSSHANATRKSSGFRKPQRSQLSTRRSSRSAARPPGVMAQREAPLSLVAKRVQMTKRPTPAPQLQRVDESVASESTASLTPALHAGMSFTAQNALVPTQQQNSSPRHAGRLSLPALTLSSTSSRSRIASRRVVCSRVANEALSRRAPGAAPTLNIVEEESSTGACARPAILAVSPMKVHRRISAGDHSLSQRSDATSVGTSMLQPLVAERKAVPSGRGARIGNKRGTARRGGKINDQHEVYEPDQHQRLSPLFSPNPDRRLTKADIKFSPRQVLRNFL